MTSDDTLRLSAATGGGMKISGNTVVEQPEAHRRESCLILGPTTDRREMSLRESRTDYLQDHHMPISTYAVSTTGWIWMKFTITILTAQG